MTKPLSDEIAEYVADCFRCETAPRVSELAQRLGVSREALNRRTKRHCGAPAGLYLKALQVSYAQELLADSGLSATNVAYQAGFGTRRTFFRVFRRVTGATPAEFRSWAGRSMDY